MDTERRIHFDCAVVERRYVANSLGLDCLVLNRSSAAVKREFLSRKPSLKALFTTGCSVSGRCELCLLVVGRLRSTTGCFGYSRSRLLLAAGDRAFRPDMTWT